MSKLLKLAERRLLADFLIRHGIRQRLEARSRRCVTEQIADNEVIRQLQDGTLAEATDRANEQHYEVPTPYFQLVLGKHLKYSSAYWPEGCTSLDEAETCMLDLSCKRAQLVDGQDVLELGCGWGSLTLFMAERFPSSRITAVSNSSTQRQYITAEAARRGLGNVNVLTADINDFAPSDRYDRIVSVEMLEHVRNHRKLFASMSAWLKPQARVFIHVFAHKAQAYLFETEAGSRDDWMAEHFFAGGIMPSATLLPEAARGSLHLEEEWEVNGQHYSRTLEAWLLKQDANEQHVRAIFSECYGKRDAGLWLQRWRMFYMACSELFNFRDGSEWFVKHYRFSPEGEQH